MIILDETDYIYEEAKRLEQGLELLDRNRLAKYLLDENKAEKRSVLSFTEVLLIHLLKCIYQPEKTTRSWHKSIKDCFKSLSVYVGESKLLYSYLNDNFDKVYRRARNEASLETCILIDTFPKDNIFKIDDILNEDWIYDFLEEHKIVEW